MSEAFCAAVDWGTTSFRIWLLDAGGRALAVRRSGEGMTACAPDRFATVLDAHLAALGASATLPVIACGMAGSRQGWREAPYLDAPALLSDIALGAVVVPGPRDIRILPGICQRKPASPDVMRGEETQLLGIAAGRRDFVACMPGTHCKWVQVSGGAVRRFRSFMTGELYAAIGEHTILRHSLGGGEAEAQSPSFDRAVEAMLHAPNSLTAELFAIRAGQLLGEGGDAPAALSGLLIGAEIAATRAEGLAASPVTLVAHGRIAALYARALRLAGVDHVLADSEDAVVGGLFFAAQALFGSQAELPERRVGIA